MLTNSSANRQSTSSVSNSLYPLMTCTDGADFSSWTVNMTVNGTAHANVANGEVGMRGRVLKVVRKATGLWLKVVISGVSVHPRAAA